MYENDFDITNGLSYNVRTAIQHSIDNSDKKTFSTLNSFISKIISLSVEHLSLKHFKEFISLYPYIYSNSYKNKDVDHFNYQFFKISSQTVTRNLKEVIWLRVDRIKSNELVGKNQFYLAGFKCFSELLYRIIMFKDEELFDFAMNEFNQIASTNYNSVFQLRSEVRILTMKSQERIDSNLIEKLDSKKKELEQQEEFYRYQKLTILGIKYWSLLLYNVGYISRDLTLKISRRLITRVYQEVFEEIMETRSRPFSSRMGWDSWDYKERQNFKAYQPPKVAQWISFGYFVDVIKDESLFPFSDRLEQLRPESLKYLYSDFKGYSISIKKNFDKWSEILDLETVDDFDQKVSSILNSLEIIQTSANLSKEKEIALSDIKPEKVTEFRDKIGKAWKQEARIHNLFEKFGNVVANESKENQLKIIGQSNFIDRGKVMFISGNHYQNIYGLEKIGSVIGRWEDDEFFKMLLDGEPAQEYFSTSGKGVVETLENSIYSLKIKNVNPDLIFMPPEYTHMDQNLLDDKRFVSSKYIEEEKDLSFFKLGTFDQIPIYSSFSNFLQNKVVVCNFRDAFQLEVRKNINWIDEHLNLEVLEVSHDKAIEKFSEDPNKWKKMLGDSVVGDKEALNLVRTSIIINAWTVKKFSKKNIKSYVVGYMRPQN